MTEKAFDAIMAGLRDAVAFAEGDTTRGTVSTVEVPLVDVKAARTRLGLSQPAFARTFGVSVATVRNWEQHRRRPQGAARILLNIIALNPEVAVQAITDARRSGTTADPAP